MCFRGGILASGVTLLVVLSTSAVAQATAPVDALECPTVTVLDVNEVDQERGVSTGAGLLSDLDDALRAIVNRYPSSLRGAVQDALGRARELASFDGDFLPPRGDSAPCAAASPDMKLPDDFVAFDLQYTSVELDFGDSLPGVSRRERSVAKADPRARMSEWGPDKVVTEAIRFATVHLPSLVSDLEQAERTARGTRPRWRQATIAIERARSRVRAGLRIYDSSLAEALCQISAARRDWPVDRPRALESLLGAAELLGTGPELNEFHTTLQRLARSSDTERSAILQTEERLHGLLSSRACVAPGEAR